MRQKRGQAGITSTIYALLELAILAMFIAVVLIKVTNTVNDQTYLKRFYVRDIALLADTMHSAEGDFKIQYEMITHKKTDMDIYLSSGKVSISSASSGRDQQDGAPPASISFLFGQDNNTQVTPSASYNNELGNIESENGVFQRFALLQKKEGKLTISDGRIGDIELLPEAPR